MKQFRCLHPTSECLGSSPGYSSFQILGSTKPGSHQVTAQVVGLLLLIWKNWLLPGHRPVCYEHLRSKLINGRALPVCLSFSLYLSAIHIKQVNKKPETLVKIITFSSLCNAVIHLQIAQI